MKRPCFFAALTPWRSAIMGTVGIAENVEHVGLRIARAAERVGRSPAEVTLVAVSKGLPAEEVVSAFRAGLRHFGENRVQEAQDKMPQLAALSPRPTWHLVGHLQSNKAKLALSLFNLIHSLDTVKLAAALSQRAQQRMPVLLEVNLSQEATRFGFAEAALPQALRDISALPNLTVVGLMAIAPVVSDPEQARPYFRRLRQLRDALGLRELSMGMSDDYEVAVEEGATMLRIGRALFGYERRPQ